MSKARLQNPVLKTTITNTKLQQRGFVPLVNNLRKISPCLANRRIPVGMYGGTST
ncbi:MAG: hypothetical protein N4A72_00045 [Bacteroidales bacterium]|jgi:hypothetical protein|nr:hypothetical protein [Bacteroidales bacterium]